MSLHDHCMLDLETLGTTPGSAILSIGACLFDKNGVGSTFYVTVNSADSKACGFKADKSTLEWWRKQSPEAQAAAFKGELAVKDALTQFNMWLPESAKVWGNGSNFDNVLLAAYYKQMGMDLPWKFWNDRCFRTVKNLHPNIIPVTRKGTHHNALDDAIFQAECLIQSSKEHNYVLA